MGFGPRFVGHAPLGHRPTLALSYYYSAGTEKLYMKQWGVINNGTFAVINVTVITIILVLW